MTTYAHDPALPRLPVPELRDTCDALVSLMRPLLEPAALTASLEALSAFRAPGGAGEILHNVLLERAAALPGNVSWLRPFWDDAYLTWRDPLPGNMNYVFRFDGERWGSASAPPRLVLALVRVLESLGREATPPERTKAGFLTMDSARSCAYTRFPGVSRDTLTPVPLGGEQNIAVVCKGHWFLLPLRGRDGDHISEQALARAFAAIRVETAEYPPAPPVAALTAAPRAEAAALRDDLLASLQNRLSLAALEGALFAVCLDEAHADEEDLGLKLLGGDAACRWFDKSLQIIATENGGLGANFEHAGCDASIWVYLLSLADALILENVFPDGVEETPRYRLLPWDVRPKLQEKLCARQRTFADAMGAMRLACGEFVPYSRDELIGLNTSPDAFLQIAFQAAQRRVFGKLRSSYEAVAVRGFFQGRTECARGSTGEASALAEALESGASDDVLSALYRKAEREHLARVKRCGRGLGAERHLFGLEMMYSLYGRELGMETPPALFTSEGWRAVQNSAVSTSGLKAPFIKFFGFPPVVADGFGVGYVPEKKAVNLMISSFYGDRGQAADFLAAFAAAAAALRRVLAKER